MPREIRGGERREQARVADIKSRAGASRLRVGRTTAWARFARRAGPRRRRTSRSRRILSASSTTASAAKVREAMGDVYRDSCNSLGATVARGAPASRGLSSASRRGRSKVPAGRRHQHASGIDRRRCQSNMRTSGGRMGRMCFGILLASTAKSTTHIPRAHSKI